MMSSRIAVQHSWTQQQPRLSKAKSSPNVSKPTASKQVAPVRTTKTGNVTIVQINGSEPQVKPASRSCVVKPVVKEPVKKKPVVKSCSILEDRVLLKKGLSPPVAAKLPRKPDKTLNRSTSLWNVQPRQTKSASPQPQQRCCRAPTKTLSRATSLWSVPGDPQCRLGKMPSRIPLSTQHLGQSLGDLSLVDRAPGEKTKRIVDEVDRSVDEHIYENMVKSSSPIYENLEKKPIPMTTSELEKRAEELLHQLDEDDDEIVVPAKRQEMLSRSRDDLSTKKEPLLDKGRSFAKSYGNLTILPGGGSKNETSIQEIRRNWERQIERCQDKKPRLAAKSSVIISAPATLEKKKKPTAASGCKREIEQLVNFFNCKNTEVAKSWSAKAATGAPVKQNCGYASDGNSSEDSGHISNESDDPKDCFLKEIIAAPGSSGSSTCSIDAGWEDAKSKPTPTQRQNVPSQVPTAVWNSNAFSHRVGEDARFKFCTINSVRLIISMRLTF